ncbi:cytochrome P450 [Dietzia kunjamensis]|uniref:cytochrome P450 n=1 Tax=Dietzia kunjamensis TaxID=322509 RepID=UPI002DB88E6B|nr:cytochrome P450 [Dietzia kunjamensis]MEB8326574.1 cytochrome P450 [Dietzia kunjamensis]
MDSNSFRPEVIDTAFPWPRPPIDPPLAYNWLRDNEPIRQVETVGGGAAWLITRYDDVRTILSDARVSSDSQNPGFPRFGAPTEPEDQRLFLRMDPPQHTIFRDLLAKNFTLSAMKKMRPAIQELVDETIATMLSSPDRKADFVEEFALPIPSTVLSWLLGVRAEDRAFFNSAADRALAATDPTNPDALEIAMTAMHELRTYIRSIAEERAAQDDPGDDIMGQLVGAARAGDITMMDVENSGFLLIIAGHDTTTNMTALGTYTLLQHRDLWNEIREEPSLVRGAVEELLRYLTVVHLVILRVATEDIQIGGVTIKAGDAIIPLNLAANRDDAHFPEADQLDIHRKDRDHFAFGYGIHQCVGQALARLELQVIFETLTRRVPNLRLDADPADLPFKQWSGINGLFTMPVTW